MPDSAFASLLGWLEARLGQDVAVYMTGPAESRTNVRLFAHGVLRRSEGPIALIEPRRGDVVSFAVGDGDVVLLEGDLRELELEAARVVTLSDGRSVEIPASALADFGEVMLHFSGGVDGT